MSIHFSGRERHVLREQYAQSKEKMDKKKTCNDILHMFWGKSGNMIHLMKGKKERQERKESKKLQN